MVCQMNFLCHHVRRTMQAFTSLGLSVRESRRKPDLTAKVPVGLVTNM